jgi:hypothetical protein
MILFFYLVLPQISVEFANMIVKDYIRIDECQTGHYEIILKKSNSSAFLITFEIKAVRHDES